MFFEVYIFYLVSTKNNISSFGRGGRKAQSFHETIADLSKTGACELPRVDAGKGTWILWKKRKCSDTPSLQGLYMWLYGTILN